MKKILFTLIMLICVSFGQQSILVEANQMEYEKNTIIYTGKVKATRGMGVLTADKVIVYLDENKRAKKLEAIGNVVYTENRRRARGDMGEYDLNAEVLRLTGNARVEEGPNFVEADEIIYYKKEDRAVAVSKEKRVRSFYVEEKNEKVGNNR